MVRGIINGHLMYTAITRMRGALWMVPLSTQINNLRVKKVSCLWRCPHFKGLGFTVVYSLHYELTVMNTFPTVCLGPQSMVRWVRAV